MWWEKRFFCYQCCYVFTYNSPPTWRDLEVPDTVICIYHSLSEICLKFSLCGLLSVLYYIKICFSQHKWVLHSPLTLQNRITWPFLDCSTVRLTITTLLTSWFCLVFHRTFSLDWLNKYDRISTFPSTICDLYFDKNLKRETSRQNYDLLNITVHV